MLNFNQLRQNKQKMDPNARLTVVERLKQANNVLVTVSANPSVDQLAACIGLTLLLNKMGKHATAVFSGAIPSTIEFLQPEKTLEKTTDSLRDFIIALDKSKADKLRYKVEDKVVKIFITPYRTTITDKDLEFSQGDFNVDVVMALGVHRQADLDQAITAHGRILHDATVVSVNNTPNGELGSINWLEIGASSLSEMLVSLSDGLGPNLLDAQMATAFLTGIVAETQRFSNEKASPQTMTIAGKLMSVGASTQLVASRLEEHMAEVKKDDQQEGGSTAANLPKPPAPAPNTNGTLEIQHDQPKSDAPPPPEAEAPNDPIAHIDIDDQGNLHLKDQSQPKPPSQLDNPSMITQPPTFGATLTANSQIDPMNRSSDPLSLPSIGGSMLDHEVAVAPDLNEEEDKTLTEIEKDVDSPHTKSPDATHLNDARSAVQQAVGGKPSDQPLGYELHPSEQNNSPTPPSPQFNMPPNLVPPSQPNTGAGVTNPLAPPPVPPPMMPPMENPSGAPSQQPPSIL